MTEVIDLKVENRDKSGKGNARAVRNSGYVPGVIYGGEKAEKPNHIQVSRSVLEKYLHAGGFFTKLFDLDLDGKKQRVLARDVQLHVVNEIPQHIDFLRVTDSTRLNVEIPVHVQNQEVCPGLKAGGVLNMVRYHIELECSANNIPEYIAADLKELEMGDSLHISEVTLPEGVNPTTDRDFTILQIAAPKLAMAAEELEAEEAEAAEAAAAEGEDAPAEDAEAGEEKPAEGDESSEGEKEEGGSE